MIENCASTPLYSVLKRQDEKFVTEHAYENPRFVEDMVREVYLGLKKMGFAAPGGGADEDGVSWLPVGYLIPEGIRHILAAAGMHPVKGGELAFPGSNGAGL